MKLKSTTTGRGTTQILNIDEVSSKNKALSIDNLNGAIFNKGSFLGKYNINTKSITSNIPNKDRGILYYHIFKEVFNMAKIKHLLVGDSDKEHTVEKVLRKRFPISEDVYVVYDVEGESVGYKLVDIDSKETLKSKLSAAGVIFGDSYDQ